VSVSVVSAPPCDLAAERGVLGALIAAPRHVPAVTAGAGLKAEFFYYESHGVLFAAICALYDADKTIDERTINAELRERGKLGHEVGEHLAAELYAESPAASTAPDLAAIVVREAEWRTRLAAGQQIQQAVAARDADLLVEAEAMLQTDLTHADADLETEDLYDLAHELLEHGGAEAFPWPFKRLNDLTAGGMRRGEFVVIGGHSSHGKSQFLDQTLTGLHKEGARVRLYMNEMSAAQRVARMLTRKTGIPFSKIVRGELSHEQQLLANRALNEADTFPFGITLAAGWSATDIAHHIRRNGYDVAAVDIMHLIQYEDERDLSAITATFARTAVQANCVVLSTAHLNEKRVVGVVRPRPTEGDLRGSGSIKNDADIVCFVHREQNPDTGDREPEGAIYFTKVRNGPTGGMEAYFKEDRLRFVPISDGRAGELPGSFVDQEAVASW
jgi:replicative DNA helicase